MLKNKGPLSIIRLLYVMMTILVFCLFTTRATRWQQQFVFILIKLNRPTKHSQKNYNSCHLVGPLIKSFLSELNVVVFIAWHELEAITSIFFGIKVDTVCNCNSVCHKFNSFLYILNTFIIPYNCTCLNTIDRSNQ